MLVPASMLILKAPSFFDFKTKLPFDASQCAVTPESAFALIVPIRLLNVVFSSIVNSWLPILKVPSASWPNLSKILSDVLIVAGLCWHYFV